MFSILCILNLHQRPGIANRDDNKVQKNQHQGNGEGFHQPACVEPANQCAILRILQSAKKEPLHLWKKREETNYCPKDDRDAMSGSCQRSVTQHPVTQDVH